MTGYYITIQIVHQTDYKLFRKKHLETTPDFSKQPIPCAIIYLHNLPPRNQ